MEVVVKLVEVVVKVGGGGGKVGGSGGKVGGCGSKVGGYAGDGDGNSAFLGATCCLQDCICSSSVSSSINAIKN